MLVWDIYYKVHMYLHILNVNTLSIINQGHARTHLKEIMKRKKSFASYVLLQKNITFSFLHFY